MGYKDDLDLYAYAHNDPLNLTDPTGNDSFVVARLLNSPLGVALVGHAFVVTNARYLGDPEAHVYSFGMLANGKMGNVSDPARAAPVSQSTSASDRTAWANLAIRGGESNVARIEAPDNTVDAVANDLMETMPYSLLPSPGTTAGTGNTTINITLDANSNSAAFAIGDRATQIAKKNPRAHVPRKPFTLVLPGKTAAPHVNFKNEPCGGTIAPCHSGSGVEFWD